MTFGPCHAATSAGGDGARRFHQKRAYAYAGVTVFFWSTAATAFKLTLQSLNPAQLLLLASVFSTTSLAMLLLISGRLGMAIRSLRRFWKRSLLLGVLNPLIYYLVLFESYNRLPAQVAQPLNYTWALTLSYLSVPLLGQRLGRRDFWAGLVAYCGVLVICTRGQLQKGAWLDPIGIVLALGSTVIWALYWIYNTRDERDPSVALFQNFAVSLPLAAVVCLAWTGFSPVIRQGMLGAVYIGVFEMGVTYVLWLKALRYSENAAKVSNLIFMAPFLSLVFIHFIVGEPLFPSTFLGLGLIVGGLMIQRR